VVFLQPTAAMAEAITANLSAADLDAFETTVTDVVDLAHQEWSAFPLVNTPNLHAGAESVGGWDPLPSSYLGLTLERLHPAA
jgi:hypothetical protein